MDLQKKYVGKLENVLHRLGKAVPVVAIVLVVTLAVIVFVTMPNPLPGTSPLGDGVLTSAPKGEVVSGFPKDLLVEKGVEIQDSYSLSYSGGSLNQPVVTYISKWPMVQNVAQFGAYLRKNGWTITHEADSISKNTFYYANKDNNDLNITLATEEVKNAGAIILTPEAGKVRVTISYVKR